MNKRAKKSTQKQFLTGFLIGISFCGAVAIMLLIILWILL